MRTALEIPLRLNGPPPRIPTTVVLVPLGQMAAPPAPTPHPPGSGVLASSGGMKPPRIQLAPLADAGRSPSVPVLRRPSPEPVRLEPFDASIDPVAADAAFTLANPLDRCITRLARNLLVRAMPQADELIEPPLVRKGEPQLLVGWVAAPAEDRAKLEQVGICLEFATYDDSLGRFVRCLFSERVADLLQDLHLWGSFPFPFEAGPSIGGLEELLLRIGCPRQYDLIGLDAYLLPAPLEAVAALAQLEGEVPHE